MKNKKNEYLQEKTNKEGKQYAIEKFIKDCTYSDGNSKYEFVSRNVIKAVDKNEKNDYCDGILGLCFDDESDLIINFNNLEKTEKALSEKLELDLSKKSYIDTINLVNEYAQKIEESEDDLDWASKEMAERYLKIIKLIYGIKLLFTKEGKTNNIYIKDIGDINFSEMNSHILKEDPRISDPRFAINPSEEINNKVQKRVYKIILCAAKNGEEVLQDNEFVIEVRDLLIKLAKKENIGILISSHNLAELDNFVTNACIIQNGRIVAVSKVEDLKKGEKSAFVIDLDKTDGVEDIIKYECQVMKNNMIKVFMDRKDVPDLLSKLLKHKYKVYEVRMLQLSLEDAFLEKTGGNVID